jgi:putative flippase GtrA
VLNIRSAVRKLVTFGAVGIAASLIYGGTFLSLLHLSMLPVLAINAVAFAASAVCSYIGHYHLTFRSDAVHRVSVAKFLVLCGMGYILSSGIVFAGEWLKLPPEFDVAATFVVLPIMNFVVMQFWVFTGQVRRA